MGDRQYKNFVPCTIALTPEQREALKKLSTIRMASVETVGDRVGFPAAGALGHHHYRCLMRIRQPTS